MNIAMVVAGCAPAFTDMYIEALGDAGVQYGRSEPPPTGSPPRWSKVSARFMATETHPGAMKDAVCRPAPPSGRRPARKDGFRGSVIDAVDAIVG